MAKVLESQAIPAKAARRGGNTKSLIDDSPGPWMFWPKGMSRHARAIKFIESYCVAPKGYNAGKLMTLAPFQKEWLEEVMAPGIHAAVQSMPRGNGKSTFDAALGLHAVFDPGESGDPQVPVIATTVKQAVKTIYGPAVRMLELNSELGHRAKTYTAMGDTKILVPFTNGEMFPIAEDPDGLQGLDPSLGLVDEIGFMKLEAWASLLLATGKRPDSLIIAIGTPGFDMENALWHVRKTHGEGEKIVHFTEYSADLGCDIRDEAQWTKSNPAYVAGFKGRHAFEVALSLPEALFRIFQLGQWVMGTQSWLGADAHQVWLACQDPYAFQAGAATWVGVDMSRSRDCSAVVAVQRRSDGRLHAKAKVWYPHSSATGVIDGKAVQNYIRDLHRLYDVVACGYDPRFFEERAETLSGEKVKMIEFPQSIERMTPACGDTYELIINQQLTHDDDDEFMRHILNAVPKFNSERGFTLKKETPESPKKIDSAVALCMAVKLATAPIKQRSALVVL